MRLMILMALGLLSIGPAGHAQSTQRCRHDNFGNSTCQDNEGHVSHGWSDNFGNTVITDDAGHQTHVHSDQFGNVTVQGDNGAIIQGHTDPIGTTTYTDQSGRTTHCRPSAIALPGQTTTNCY